MMAAQYVLRVKQPDGSWRFDLDNPMSKREANRSAKTGRCLAGILSQVWTEKEAMEAVAKAGNC